jgi:hypothetical protein
MFSRTYGQPNAIQIILIEGRLSRKAWQAYEGPGQARIHRGFELSGKA